MKKPALEIDQLTVNYEKTPVLWDISFSVPPGELVAIIGPNGAGKSTLLKAALGLVKPISGSVFCMGEPIGRVRKKIAYVPQRESVDWDFPITVFDLVLMGRYGKIGLLRRVRKEDQQAVEHYLDKVGLLPLSKRQISQLSGGQQQRAFLARALIQEAEVYFMDEPFSGIDIASQQVIVSILKELRNSGKTAFVVHHDLDTVTEIFSWAILLNLRLVASGSVGQVFTEELIHRTYGKDDRLLGEVAGITRKKVQGISHA